ncbi:UPF0764 protein C16orf89 homolog [Ctenocephalides felis]|uniref:UPF0764 protein C16orf89 homolog n=1 Tax=Ctenocephalides felis TaxID=7515 RepID=UPI000E6E3760|nr:UPF0764 protein C16orf89 homolog [Ctenocephalides felis]
MDFVHKLILAIAFAMCSSAETRITKLHPLIPLQSISLALDYMLQHPEYLNIDSIFGVTIAEARLRNIDHHLSNLDSSKSWTRSLLQNLISSCSMIRNNMMKMAQKSADDDDKIFKKLLDPSLWSDDIYPKKLSLTEDRNNWSIKKIRAHMFAGSPNETTSDNCIIEMILNAHGSFHEHLSTKYNNCSISEHCAQIMINGSVSGYPLTHRLLHLIISKRLRCSFKSASQIGVNSSEICSLVYSELFAIYKNRIPSFARDLFIEQILLCGIEGYEEFFHVKLYEGCNKLAEQFRMLGPYTNRIALQRKRL